MNTEIEPHEKGSKKLNVVKVTSLEPVDKKIVSEKKPVSNSVYTNLIHIMKESTFEYYNMKNILGLKHL